MPAHLGIALTAVVALLGLLTFSHVKAYQVGAAAERMTILNRSVEVFRERKRQVMIQSVRPFAEYSEPSGDDGNERCEALDDLSVETQ